MKACERYLNAINEFVDGTIGPIRRSELELHLESCDGCRALADDLQQIARAAQALEPLDPPEAVWTRIAARLQAEGRVAPRARPQRSHTMLALAATLALSVGASLYFVLPRDDGSAAAPTAAADQHDRDGNVGPDDPVQSVASELALSERHFQNAVEQATKTPTAVDPQTTAVLQKSLQAMNQAIAESQAALQTDPQSVQARQSLYEVLRQKIQFLQDTVALMNEMRQGDAAGAAEIVEGKS